MNSNQKGKRGERELAERIREHGFEARRGQQYEGSSDSPDVVSDIDWIHWECKYTEKFQLYPSLEKAEKEAGSGVVPVVAHRRNRKSWVAVLDLDDFLSIVGDLEYLRKETAI